LRSILKTSCQILFSPRKHAPYSKAYFVKFYAEIIEDKINSLSTTPYGTVRQGVNIATAMSKYSDGCQVGRETNVGYWLTWDFRQPINVGSVVVALTRVTPSSRPRISRHRTTT
jgi:hypothetical protein